ncbi:MAG: DsrE family protein [Cucumibacter sp.]
MSHILVHISTGPENPTKAALGFLVARTVLDKGHRLSLFIAGDGVNLLRKETAAALVGIGTGALAEHVAALDKSDAEILYSGMSAKARGLDPADLAIARAAPAMPDKLIDLTLEADAVLCY